jgi:hydrogenase assembly chaperone HypC/HupF
MCLSIPGRIVEIGENKFIIDYDGEKREAIMSVVSGLDIGDYVIVSNRIIYTKIDSEDVKKFSEIIRT